MNLDTRPGPIGGWIGRILAGKSKHRARCASFLRPFFGVPGGGRLWGRAEVRRRRGGEAGEVATRKGEEGGERKERGKGRRSGRGEEKRRRKRSRSDSTDPIRFGSIWSVRFRIQNFKFLLCLGTENEVQKFRKKFQKTQKNL